LISIGLDRTEEYRGSTGGMRQTGNNTYQDVWDEEAELNRIPP
jgi:hypothetical protein